MMDDDPLSTQDIIEEARRPLLIERHKDAVDEMEQSVAPSFVAGETNHPRLARLLQELEAESEQQRLASTIAALVNDDHYIGMPLRAALVEYLCLFRERQGIEIAALQIHVIGVYRRLAEAIREHQGLQMELDDLRQLPCEHLQRLPSIGPDREPAGFGSTDLAQQLVHTRDLIARTMTTAKRISRANGDTTWHEADGDPILARELEEPLLDLPSDEREAARAALVADKVRSRFYRNVFLKYFDPDTLDPLEVAGYGTILDWLLAIEDTPHLFPFMQGQTQAQKTWRLRNLLTKLVQLSEIYQRVDQASRHPSYQEQFNQLTTTRERLAILAKDRYPALSVDATFTTTTLLCPFRAFVSWMQEHLKNQDFVLPPDPKR